MQIPLLTRPAAVLAVALSVPVLGSGNTCCRDLSATLASKLAYPGSIAYAESISSYWARQQAVLSPSCVVFPETAADVSSALVSIERRNCQFAVRGGGHGSALNVSNVQDGVTIDLRKLNSTVLSHNNTVVTVGGGQNWYGAYALLYPFGVTLPGGRDSNVGVGGSTIGGALGYIAPSAGFGCDSVIEYEVVLANGRVVIANKGSNSDLFHALKGGGSNFGIVTKFVMNTYPLEDIWAGEALYMPSARSGQLQAFYNFASNPNYDNKADLLMTFLYTAEGGIQIADLFTYAEPKENPDAFKAFYGLEGQIINTTTVTNVPEFSITQEDTSPDGFWQITLATTFTNNHRHLEDIWTIFNKSIAAASKISVISWALTFEPLVPSLAAASKARGGNVLGLTIPPEGLVLTLGSFTFSSAADFPLASKLVDQLLAELIAAAIKNGVYNPFVELNHAKDSQKPFLSYGSTTYEFLVKTALKYDSKGVFQRLVPGKFKLY